MPGGGARVWTYETTKGVLAMHETSSNEARLRDYRSGHETKETTQC